LHGQTNQLENTKRLGLETNDYMRMANKDLRDQRDLLVSAADKNLQIRHDLERGNKIVVEMSRREFFYRMAIHATMVILFIAIVALIINKIING
jgi:hypothetical protein